MYNHKINNLNIYLIFVALFLTVKARVLINYSNANIWDTDIDGNFDDYGTTLNISNMNLKDISAGFVLSASTKSFVLQNNNIRNVESGIFDTLPNLELLDLSKNRLNVSDFLSLVHHLNLKSLILDHNREDGYKEIEEQVVASTIMPRTSTSKDYDEDSSSDVDSDQNENWKKTLYLYDHLFTFPNLMNLSLRNIGIDNFFGNWSTKFPSLNRLDLSENDISNNALSFLDSIPKSVKILTIENANLKTANISSLKLIEELNLGENNFKILSYENCIENTLCLSGANNLIKLNISKNDIKKIEKIAFKDLANLRELDLSDNKIEIILPTTFDSIPSLKVLILNRNPIHFLDGIGKLEALTHLYLDGILCGRASLRPHLIMLKPIPSLKYLSMKSNQITSVELEFLDKFSNLEELVLSNNTLTSAPLWSYASTIKILHLDNTSLTREIILNEFKNYYVSIEIIYI